MQLSEHYMVVHGLKKEAKLEMGFGGDCDSDEEVKFGQSTRMEEVQQQRMQPSDFPASDWGDTGAAIEESKRSIMGVPAGKVLKKESYREEFPSLGKVHKSEPTNTVLAK